MIRSLRSLGKTVLLTTHYLDEAEQLADRVAVMREGRIVKIGTPRELTTAELEVEIRYRRDGEEIVVRTSEPTRVLQRADVGGARARRGARAARGAAADARRGLPLACSTARRKPNEGLRARAPRAAARRSGGARRRRSSSSSSRCCCSCCSARCTAGRSTACRRRRRCSRACIGYGCANTAFAGLAIQLVVRRELGILKRLRATPLPASTYIAAMLASTLIVFVAPDGRALRDRPHLLRHAVPERDRLARPRGRPRRCGVRGARRRDGFAHPLRRGLVRGRQLHPAADGVPHGLVRPDAPLSGVLARDRRRAAA